MSLIKGWGWFSGLIHTMNLNSCQIQNHPKVTVQNNYHKTSYYHKLTGKLKMPTITI